MNEIVRNGSLSCDTKRHASPDNNTQNTTKHLTQAMAFEMVKQAAIYAGAAGLFYKALSGFLAVANPKHTAVETNQRGSEPLAGLQSQSFINAKGLRMFYNSWHPDPQDDPPVIGLVIIVHGLGEHVNR